MWLVAAAVTQPNKYDEEGGKEVYLLFVMVISLGSIFGCAPSNPTEKLGVQIASMRLTGADHFIDLRYRILDPEKATVLMDRNEQLFVVDRSTGTTHPVTRNKLGPMRTSGTKPEVNRQYNVMFSNVNRAIRAGSKVTLLVGDQRIEGLTVE